MDGKKREKKMHVVTLGDPSAEVATLLEMWVVLFLETVLTTVTEAPPSDTTHNTGCPRSSTVHPRFAIPLQVPRCMALLTPGIPKDTYSCNNACGGDTEFIKGGDISSG